MRWMRLLRRITLDMPVAHSSAANTAASLEPRRFGMWNRPASSLMGPVRQSRLVSMLTCGNVFTTERYACQPLSPCYMELLNRHYTSRGDSRLANESCQAHSAPLDMALNRNEYLAVYVDDGRNDLRRDGKIFVTAVWPDGSRMTCARLIAGVEHLPCVYESVAEADMNEPAAIAGCLRFW